MGTHAYLAPECFDDGQVGPASDLWALGATLFHAVAGRPPFERPTTTAVLRAILFEEPPPPPCPPPLAEVITGLLTRPVDQRLTAGAAHEQLQRAAATLPTVDAPPPLADPGQAGWAAQATTHHRRPSPPPPHTTHPGGPPPTFTTHPGGPPPASATNPGGPPPGYDTAQNHPPAGPPTGPVHPPSGMGPATPPPARNNTPLVLGLLGAAAAVLLVVIFSSMGGDDDSGGGNGASRSGNETENGSGNGNGQEEGFPTGSDPDAPAGGGGDEGAFAQEFLDAVNSGDEATATGALCEERGHPEDVTNAIALDASLEIDPATVEADPGTSYLASIVGTVDGAPVQDAVISVLPRIDDQPGFCVYRFDLGGALDAAED